MVVHWLSRSRTIAVKAEVRAEAKAEVEAAAGAAAVPVHLTRNK